MLSFLLTLAQTIYLTLPGIAANATPPIAARFRFLEFFNTPIDAGKTFRGKPVFGDHKTVRGYLVGIPSAILIAGIQYVLYTKFEIFRTLSPIDFETVNWLLFGFMIGLGTLVGDSIKSFFKRQFGKKPGESWFPWDQLDSVIGGLVFVSIIAPLPVPVILLAIILGPLLHVIVEAIGYQTGLKEHPETSTPTSETLRDRSGLKK